MSKTVQEIADFVGGVVAGDAQGVVIGLSGIKEAQPGALTFIANSKYLPLLDKTQATAIICPPDLAAANKTLIHCDNPSLAFAKVVPLFVDEQAQRSVGIHPTAVVSPEAELGADVSIGPYTVIENGVVIGDRSVIMSGCFIGHHTRIGADGLIHPRVTIRERIRIGQRVIIHSGAVIGSDGFGFANVAGRHEKIPQIGIVEIEDDVEIGANVTIDRARFDTTLIGQGTKIDNLVQIAHNVRIGKNCLIVAQVGISGSTVIEDNVILAGQAGLAGHLTIGAGAIVGAQAGVTESVDPGIMVSGYPARPHRHAKRVNACVQRLPGYIKTLNELKKRIEDLEARLGQGEGGAADDAPAENS